MDHVERMLVAMSRFGQCALQSEFAIVDLVEPLLVTESVCIRTVLDVVRRLQWNVCAGSCNGTWSRPRRLQQCAAPPLLVAMISLCQ